MSLEYLIETPFVISNMFGNTKKSLFINLITKDDIFFIIYTLYSIANSKNSSPVKKLFLPLFNSTKICI